MHAPSSPVPLSETLRAYDVWAQAYDVFNNPLIAMTEHVPHLQTLFQEVRRLLVPGGTCRFIEIHPGLVERGVQAHFWHEGTEYRLASFPHPAEEYAAALAAAGLEVASLSEWYATGEAEARCAKLGRYRGGPVVLDVQAARAGS